MSMVATQKTKAVRVEPRCHLATLNTPASPQDLARIQAHLEDAQKEKKDLQIQLERIERRIEELDDFFKQMTSPIRRIPPEILGEIFYWAWSLEESRKQSVLLDLCQVCKTWRDAAHLVPRFWRCIVVDAAQLTPLSYEAVSSWLARSKGLPRAMHLSTKECGVSVRSVVHGEQRVRRMCAGAVNCLFSSRTLAKILKAGPSLETIMIQCPTPECLQNLSVSLSSLFDDTPTPSWNSTASVWISATWGEEWTSTSLLSSTLCFLPHEVTDLGIQLPHTTTFGPSVKLDNVKVDIPLSVLQNLGSFTLTCSWTASHILPLLQHCSNLRFLNLDFQLGYFENWDEDDAFMQSIVECGIVLPNLRTLFLNNIDVDSVGSLPLLKLPALQELSIAFGLGDWHPYCGLPLEMSPTLASAFSDFLSGGGVDTPSTLESLMITNGVFLEDTLFEALKDLHSLKHLVVQNAVFDTETFSKISSQSLLPQLQILDLWGLHHGHGDLVGVEELVESRGIKFLMSPCVENNCECRD